MFLLVPAHPGSPGQRAVKRSLLLLLLVLPANLTGDTSLQLNHVGGRRVSHPPQDAFPTLKLIHLQQRSFLLQLGFQLPNLTRHLTSKDTDTHTPGMDYKTTGQCDLIKGRITAAHGWHSLHFTMGRPFLQNCPFPWGTLAPSDTWFHGPTQDLDRFSFFAGLRIVTDRQTDRPRYSVCDNRQHLCK